MGQKCSSEKAGSQFFCCGVCRERQNLEARKMKTPGYWSLVFAKACALMKADKRLSGDDAYWMARNAVDAEAGQLALDGVTA